MHALGIEKQKQHQPGTELLAAAGTREVDLRLHGATQSQDCTLHFDSRILAQWSELLAIRCGCHHADLHCEALSLLGGSAALHLKCLELQRR